MNVGGEGGTWETHSEQCTTAATTGFGVTNAAATMGNTLLELTYFYCSNGQKNVFGHTSALICI